MEKLQYDYETLNNQNKGNLEIIDKLQKERTAFQNHLSTMDNRYNNIQKELREALKYIIISFRREENMNNNNSEVSKKTEMIEEEKKKIENELETSKQQILSLKESIKKLKGILI